METDIWCANLLVLCQAVSIQDPRDQNIEKVNHRIVGSFKFFGCQKAMQDGYVAHGMRRFL